MRWDDALYTVKVCRKLPLAEVLAAYPSEEELLKEALLTDPDAEYHDVHTWFGLMEHGRLQGRPAALHACLPAVRRHRCSWGYLAQTRQHRAIIPRPSARSTGPGSCASSFRAKTACIGTLPACTETVRPARLCPLEAPGGGPARADAPPRRAGRRCRPGQNNAAQENRPDTDCCLCQGGFYKGARGSLFGGLFLLVQHLFGIACDHQFLVGSQ